jgi:hypothetical protein
MVGRAPPVGGNDRGAADADLMEIDAAFHATPRQLAQVVSFADYQASRDHQLIARGARRLCPVRRRGCACPWCAR